MTNSFTRNRLIGLILAGAIYALDQWIKGYVTWTLNLPEKGKIDLLPFFDLTWVENYGVSLGMLTAQSMEMRWGLVALTGLIALVVFVWIIREKLMADILGLSLVLGEPPGTSMTGSCMASWSTMPISTLVTSGLSWSSTWPMRRSRSVS